MNIIIIFMLVLNLILLPLVAYFAVRFMSRKLDTNARWHRKVLVNEVDWLLRAHGNRVADSFSYLNRR
jgi:hypothetical protein